MLKIQDIIDLDTNTCTLFPPQSSLHINGFGSVKDYPTNSKPSTSSSVVGKPNHGLASTSSSISHSISRPTVIPDHDKRQKLSFFIGQGKQSRSSSSSSHSQPSSACSSSSSSSLSSSQSTSDIRFVPRQLNHVNSKSCSNGDCPTGGNGASFLVPYSQESSEESDQENSGTLDNGCIAKSHLNGSKMGEVLDKSPQATNGESRAHHNGNRINGPTHDGSKSSQNGHYVGHNNINGHNTPDKVNYMLCVFLTFNLQITELTAALCLKNNCVLFLLLRYMAAHPLYQLLLLMD